MVRLLDFLFVFKSVCSNQHIQACQVIQSAVINAKIFEDFSTFFNTFEPESLQKKLIYRSGRVLFQNFKSSVIF